MGDEGIETGERDPKRCVARPTGAKGCVFLHDLSVPEEVVLSFMGGAIYDMAVTFRRSAGEDGELDSGGVGSWWGFESGDVSDTGGFVAEGIR